MARVLIVDDDPDILSLVQLQLRHSGYETRGASSGPDALALIEDEGPPDLAILDIRMPGMNGYELLEEIRRKGLTDMPVIFLTARAQREDLTTGIALGAVYLTKPYAVADLLGEIDRALAVGR